MARIVKSEGCPKCLARGRDSRRDNLKWYSDGGAHCFACGYHIFPKRLAQKVTHANESQTNALPRDFTREVPAAGWKWLLQYGLPYSYWKPFTGYSPADDRLIFPIGDPARFSVGRRLDREGNVVVPGPRLAGAGRTEGSHGELGGSGVGQNVRGVQGRVGGAGTNSPADAGNQTLSVRSQAGQVLPVRTPKWKLYGDRRGYACVLEPKSPGAYERVILVEDIVSAHKVAQVATAIPLFGADIPTKVLQALKALKRPTTLWLDEDQYGYLPRKINRLQAVLDVPVGFIRQRKDPKEYTIDEIKEILK